MFNKDKFIYAIMNAMTHVSRDDLMQITVNDISVDK